LTSHLRGRLWYNVILLQRLLMDLSMYGKSPNTNSNPYFSANETHFANFLFLCKRSFPEIPTAVAIINDGLRKTRSRLIHKVSLYSKIPAWYTAALEVRWVKMVDWCINFPPKHGEIHYWRHESRPLADYSTSNIIFTKLLIS